jgi:hypothetical protein
MTNHLSRLIEHYPAPGSSSGSIAATIGLLSDLFFSGHKFLICGNGGSAAVYHTLCVEVEDPILSGVKRTRVSFSGANLVGIDAANPGTQIRITL